jgi:DNA-binding NarL/FixJ family response regulator
MGVEKTRDVINQHNVSIESERRAGGVKGDRLIAVIESRVFMRECIRRSMQSALSIPVITYSTVGELERQLSDVSPELVMLSFVSDNADACGSVLKTVSELLPSTLIVILADTNDKGLVRTAINLGAKGFIPCSMGFEIAVEAVRFVLAGGTYAPTEYLLAADPSDHSAVMVRARTDAITPRELAVIRAIQQGKSNKVIAYELCMCESTVKVHVRNVMKKLQAKNRTQVAIKAQAASPQSMDMPGAA